MCLHIPISFFQNSMQMFWCPPTFPNSSYSWRRWEGSLLKVSNNSRQRLWISKYLMPSLWTVFRRQNIFSAAECSRSQHSEHHSGFVFTDLISLRLETVHSRADGIFILRVLLLREWHIWGEQVAFTGTLHLEESLTLSLQFVSAEIPWVIQFQFLLFGCSHFFYPCSLLITEALSLKTPL